MKWAGGSLDMAQLKKAAKSDRKVFFVEEDGLRPVQVFSEETGWMRVLCPTESLPTVLVSGIPMHRMKRTDPGKDTRAKIQALGVVKGPVLDTATGLGYTAIEAARRASRVVTIEIDPGGIELARMNPWSDELFSKQNIEIVIGDAYEEVKKFDRGSFAGIIHDPPTMSLGGELYSEEFYRQLRRLLKRGGRLFHYIGNPDSALGRRQYPGIISRLRAAGFAKPEIQTEAYGLTTSSL